MRESQKWISDLNSRVSLTEGKYATLSISMEAVSFFDPILKVRSNFNMFLSLCIFGRRP